jgi:uncharacterized OB-fold protein
MPNVIPPSVETDDEYFWDGVQRDELLLQKCSDCGTLRHPPVPMCGDCHSVQWHTHPAAGSGRVHSWIVSKHPTLPDDDPRIVILVELDEGLRVVSNLVDVDPADVRNEMPVELCFRTYGDTKLPQFRPAGA